MPYLHIVILYTTWVRVLYGTQFAMLGLLAWQMKQVLVEGGYIHVAMQWT